MKSPFFCVSVCVCKSVCVSLNNFPLKAYEITLLPAYLCVPPKFFVSYAARVVSKEIQAIRSPQNFLFSSLSH
jgi:hypothetical protein